MTDTHQVLSALHPCGGRSRSDLHAHGSGSGLIQVPLALVIPKGEAQKPSCFLEAVSHRQ